MAAFDASRAVPTDLFLGADEMATELGDGSLLHITECSILCRGRWVALAVDKVVRTLPSPQELDLRHLSGHITLGYFVKAAPSDMDIEDMSQNLNAGLRAWLNTCQAHPRLICIVDADDTVALNASTYMAWLHDEQNPTSLFTLLGGLQRTIRENYGKFQHMGRYHLSLRP